MEALGVYLEGIKINPAEPKLHNNIGAIYARTGRQDMAEQEFKKEIELNPQYSDTYFNLGVFYSQKRDWPRAIEYWQKTLQLDPHHERARKFLGSYLKKLHPEESQSN